MTRGSTDFSPASSCSCWPAGMALPSRLEHRGRCDDVGCREGRDGDLVSASDGPEAVTPCHSDDEGLERLLACQQLQLLARMDDSAFEVIEGDEVGHPDPVGQCYVVEVVACPYGDGNRLGGRGGDSFTRHVEDHANADSVTGEPVQTLEGGDVGTL